MNPFPKIEHKILKFWQDNKIFEKLQKRNKGSKKTFSFLDGPITANNPMGVHHGWGRTYKDLFQRYNAMKGCDERYQNGFDCQGLWVEVEVEKELGFKNKKDIESYGIAKFINKCKDRVRKYSKIQTAQSIRLGQWMDWGDWKNDKGNSYFTMSDENNYAIWHFLKECHKKDLLYKGHDVVPWCPRCGTAISQHEILTEEYKELTHKSVFVKLPILEKGKKTDKYLLVWTTTPWTLVANVAIAVNPNLDYVFAQNDNETLILAKEKAEILGDDYTIIKKQKGKSLEGIKYEGPFDDLKVNKDIDHKVIPWEDVTSEEGTGLVHIAPGCGQEDFQLSKKEKLDVITPLNDDSRYTKDFEWLTGKTTQEATEPIFEDLEKKGFLFKVEDYTHRYPTCWRCKEELVFRLVDEWYIKMNPIRENLKKNTRKIKWIPDFGLPRELDWLKNMDDWLISKKRYWGLALPIFECDCGHFEVIGGYDELKKKAVSGWKQFDKKSPHRPQVDKIQIKCPKCGKLISRIKDVGNPWLDAGIVGFSTINYFNDKKYWKKWFPVDLICESFPGQFKNWFYSLIAMSGVLENIPPTKTLFGYGSVVDEKGEEMHKSKGNAIWFDDAVEKIGADVMRWIYSKQNPAANLRFGFNVADEARKRILILWNTLTYFKTYAQKQIGPKFQMPKNLTLLDKWILSRLNSLILKVSESLDKYDAMTASQSIEDFFINGLSTWYIRRSRERFQKLQDKDASLVFFHVLLELVKLIAPFIPLLAEEMYQELKLSTMPLSVHLCEYPKGNKKLVDEELENQMIELRDTASLALAQRAEANIKVRQPLAKLAITNKKILASKELVQILKEEINVKEVVSGKKLKLDIKISSELKAEGTLRELVRVIQGMRKSAGLKPGEIITLRYLASGFVKDLIMNNVKNLKEQISADEIELAQKKKEVFLVEKEFDLEGNKMWLAIKK